MSVDVNNWNLEKIEATIQALSDATRRAILSRLAEGEATVGEIAAPFDMSQPAISHHLKVLEEAGLILRRIDGQRRPCRLAPDGLAPLERWIMSLRNRMEANYACLDGMFADRPAKPER